MPARPNFYYNNPYMAQIAHNLSAAIYGTPELEGMRLENERKRQAIDAAYEKQLEEGRRKGYEEEFWRRYAEAQAVGQVAPEAAAENADFRELTGVDNPYLVSEGGSDGMLGAIFQNPEVMRMAVMAGLIDPKDLMTTERNLTNDQLRYQGTLARTDATRYTADVRADAARDTADIRGRYGVNAAGVRGRYAVEAADTRGRWGYDTQGLRNKGALDTQGLRNEGALATQDRRNAGNLATAQARGSKGNLPLDVDENAAAAINQMVLATAARELTDPEDYRVLVEGQAEIEALAGQYYQQTRNLPMAVSMAWSEVMGFEPMIEYGGNWNPFAGDTATIKPGAGAPPAAAAPTPAPVGNPAAAAKPPAAGAKPAAAPAGQPVIINSPQERDALPKGTPYIAAGDPSKTVRVRQ